MSVFCSWSGGKESSLALARFLQNDRKVDYLLTMFPREKSDLGHGAPNEFYKIQAESIGIEMIGEKTDWKNYEKKFSSLVEKINPEIGVFGDVYIKGHKEWVEDKAEELGFETSEPLWGEKPEELLEEYLNLGFEGIIVKVAPDKISPNWLGEPLDGKFLDYLDGKEICPIGEKGEYHTATLNGPIFDEEILVELGEKKEYGENLIIDFKKFELI